MSAISVEVSTVDTQWRKALIALGAALVALLLIYHQTVWLMVATWARSDTFAHAFLVPPISAWLIWRRRERLARVRPSSEPWILVPIALAALLWLLGDLVAVNAATQLALVAMIVLSVPAVLGRRVAREILFPLAFLFFCVPIGEFLLPLLMEATADFTVAALQFSRVPVYREGLQFIIPSGQWSVVEACSGVRYLIASFMVGSLFGYLNYSSNRKRWIFVGVSLVMPIIANWLRAYMIVMIGHLSNNKLAVGVDHLVYGWVFFGVVIAAMFIIGARWADPEQPALDAAGPTAATSGTAGSSWSPAAVAAAMALLLVMPRGVVAALERSDGAVRVPVLSLPDKLASGAQAAPAPSTAWKPRFSGAAAELSRSYAVGAQIVEVHIAYYRAQTYERKLVGSDNVLVHSSDHDWLLLQTMLMPPAPAGQAPAMLKSEIVQGGALGNAGRTTLNVLQVYWVNGHYTTSDHWAKVLGALARLTGQGDDGAAIFLFTLGDATTVGVPALTTFAAANFKDITEALQKAQAVR